MLHHDETDLGSQAEEVRDDLARQIESLWEENEQYPSLIGVELLKTMREFLDVSDAMGKEETPEGVEVLRERAGRLQALIQEQLVAFEGERERRKLEEMARSIAGEETAAYSWRVPSVLGPGNSIENPS